MERTKQEAMQAELERRRELELTVAHLERRRAGEVEAAERRSRVDAHAHGQRRIFRGLLS